MSISLQNYKSIIHLMDRQIVAQYILVYIIVSHIKN